MQKACRFKDIAVGALFRIELAGATVIAEKVATDQMRTQKLNSSGELVIKVNPELNQDDVFPINTH